jgi:hypothetical protein
MTLQCKYAVGDKMHRLTVSAVLPRTQGFALECQCSCGKQLVIPASQLGNLRSCGCAMKDRQAKMGDRPPGRPASARTNAGCQYAVGDKVHRLLVTAVVKRAKGYTCSCKCDCGATLDVGASQLGFVRSCGCAMKDHIARLSQDQLVDMKGQRSGKLTVLDCLGRPDGGHYVMWRCKCDCGEFVEVRGTSLRGTGRTKSCGCLRSALRVPVGCLLGRRFGQLLVVNRAPHRVRNREAWDCLCDCGAPATVVGTQLSGGQTKSCGCLKRKVFGRKFEPAKQMENAL